MKNQTDQLAADSLDTADQKARDSQNHAIFLSDAFGRPGDSSASIGRGQSDNLQLASLAIDENRTNQNKESLRSAGLSEDLRKAESGGNERFELRADGKVGVGTLGLNLKQLERAVQRLDPEIWEHPAMSAAEKQKVQNLRQLAGELKQGKNTDELTFALRNNFKTGDKAVSDFLNKYPNGMIQKINSFLIGEQANEIMKQSLANGTAARFSEPDRLLKEAALSLSLGRMPTGKEFDDNSGKLAQTINELRKQYAPSQEWSRKDHEFISKKSDEQQNDSTHWSNKYQGPTKNGFLACAAFITNGKAADGDSKGILPSLDLNMNGVVGESLIRGFQPRRLEDAVAEGRNSNGEAMGFLVRPPRVADDFKSQRAGHIGFFNSKTESVNHNNSSSGRGKSENARTSSSFRPDDGRFVLVPPGWDKITKR